jgi:hypothetical protein
MIAGAFISWPLYFNNYAADDTVSIHCFPMTIGEWTGEDIPISDDTYADSRNPQRLYTTITPTKTTTTFYSISSIPSITQIAHPPEICYTGSGATIVTKYPYKIDYNNGDATITVNRVFYDEKDTSNSCSTG